MDQGLVDMRRGRPSPRRTPVAEVERILGLYRESYPGFNGRHFFQTVRREHGVKLSYSCVKQILQGAGLIKNAPIAGTPSAEAGEAGAVWGDAAPRRQPSRVARSGA